jgi:hypothetical protein
MMSRRSPRSTGRLGLALAICSIALVSLCALECSARGVSPSTSVQDARSSWRLTFNISGGFAGFDRTLELSSAGSAKAIDRRRTRQVDRQLSRDEIQEIDRLAASVTSFEGSARTQCRDCLTYSLDLEASGRRVAVRVADDHLAESNAAMLITSLTRILNRLLAEP